MVHPPYPSFRHASSIFTFGILVRMKGLWGVRTRRNTACDGVEACCLTEPLLTAHWRSCRSRQRGSRRGIRRQRRCTQPVAAFCLEDVMSPGNWGNDFRTVCLRTRCGFVKTAINIRKCVSKTYASLLTLLIDILCLRTGEDARCGQLTGAVCAEGWDRKEARRVRGRRCGEE